jgi:F420-dependent oxidoreductase-like protein
MKLRIGLTGGAKTVNKLIDQAQRAEDQGFTSLWYASTVLRDPLAAMALAGRETTRIELGTALLQSFPCHPVLQANRVLATAEAMGRPGFTLGVGPSHASVVEDVYGMPYDHPGRNTEDYLTILTAALRGQAVNHTGQDWSAHIPAQPAPEAPVPVLLSALSPRMLRLAGHFTDGALLWMASARAIENHIAPKLRAAASEAGRGAPRIVAGLPVAVHHDDSEARLATTATAVSYAHMPNYQRIIGIGGGHTPADVAIIGDEDSVAKQLQALIEAGATDIWAQPVAVGADREARAASLRRTISLLSQLIRSNDSDVG